MTQKANQLITKYRPATFDEVVGNAQLVRSLANVLKRPDRPHGYLLTGISGIGKTTLARISARQISTHPEEIDTPLHGIEGLRYVVQHAGSSIMMATRFIIIDEVHALSKQALGMFLKFIEDPPDSVYVALCTTEPDSIPSTIKRRCFPVDLKPLTAFEIRQFIVNIAALEGWDIPKDVLRDIVVAANGSPGMALMLLEGARAAQPIEGEIWQGR